MTFYYKDEIFQFKGEDLKSVYKYLGIWIDQSLKFDFYAKQLSCAGGCALGKLISIVKNFKDLNCSYFVKVFESMVISIIEFKVINDIQMRACYYMLGVHKFCPILGLIRETGIKPMTIHGKIIQ